MSRPQALARALVWSVLVVGASALLVVLPPVNGLWRADAAETGPAPTSTQAPDASTSTTSVTAPRAPSTEAPAPPPTAVQQAPTTLAPPITVGPPITVRPAGQGTSSVPATDAPSPTEEPGPVATTTTTTPELLVPAPPGSEPETTTTSGPSGGEDEGLSPSSKLALAVAGLLGAALLIAILTVVYFFRTRPGRVPEEALGEEPEAGAEDAEEEIGAQEPSTSELAEGAQPRADDTGGRAVLARLLAENDQRRGAGPGETSAGRAQDSGDDDGDESVDADR